MTDEQGHDVEEKFGRWYLRGTSIPCTIYGFQIFESLGDMEVCSEGAIIDGRKEGMWKSHSSDGILLMQIGFHNGERHGAVIGYDPSTDGKVFVEGFFSHGLKTGKWKIFSTDGSVEREENYKEGLLIH